MSPLVARALEIARSQVGVAEASRNRGPEVDEYIRAAGLDPAGRYAWCAAFLVWCFKRAAAELDQPNKTPLPRTAKAVRLWQKSPAWALTKEPAVGAIFVHAVDPEDYNSAGHCGIVYSFGPDQILTIEGNTNEAGEREGKYVMLKTRPRSYVNMGYVDLSRATGVA